MDREFSFDISNIIIKEIKAEPIVGAVITSIQPNGIKVEIPTIGPSETVVVVIPGSIICC